MVRNTSQPGLRSALLRLGLAAVLLLGCGIYVWSQARNPGKYTVEIVKPSCTDSGYSLYTHLESGSVEIRDVTDPLGHRYGGWEVLREGSAVDCKVRSRSCTVCADEEQQAIYPELAIPRISLSGSLEGIGKKTEVDMTVEFFGPDPYVSDYARLKYQGHSTLNYEKKNYTLKFYLDAAREEKHKMTFSHWNPENKYILKANYLDPTQGRNLVCADLWAQMVQSRQNPNPRLSALSNFGAVDGFPIALYINHSFQGIYTMNLHKDDDLFGMKDGEHHAIMITNAPGEEASFRKQAAFSKDSPWEVEYCGTPDSTWAREKLNELIDFVRTSTDEQFRRDLQKYLDVEGAIDYLLAVWALGLPENGVKDLVLCAWSESEPWTVSLHDMEQAFGLMEDGAGSYGPEEFLPVKTNGTWDSATGSLLFDRLLNQFQGQISARYNILKETTLNPEYITRQLTEFTGQIPQELWDADAALYGTDPFDQTMLTQIREYLTERAAALDKLI